MRGKMELSDSPFAEPHLSVRAYRGEYGDHRHAHSQVLVGLRGSLQLEVNGHSAFVDSSCGLVIPAGSSHGYLAETTAEMLVVDCPSPTGKPTACGVSRCRCSGRRSALR